MLKSLEDFDPNQEIEYSWTTPSSWYIDEDFHQAELERLFTGTGCTWALRTS